MAQHLSAPAPGLLSPQTSTLGRMSGSSANDLNSHFAEAHGNRRVHEVHHPLSWRHLFKYPVVRQWIVDGKLYKGGRTREATYVELFFDLMYVGIVHQLAESAVEPVSARAVIKYILVYYGSWTVWSDVRNFINHSGTDDVLQRIYILLVMLLLVGYSAMAASIEFVLTEGESEDESPGESEGGGHKELMSMISHNLTPESYTPLRAAVAFLLVAKALRLGLYLIYAILLPRFRISHCQNAVLLVLPCLILLPLMWVKSQAAVVGCASGAIVFQLGSRYVVALVARLDRNSAIFGGRDWLVPAWSIEHLIERMSAFVVIVLGESIINSTYKVGAESGQVGISTAYWRAALSICISFFIMWIYFDADSSRAYIHALRRHWLTSVLIQHLYWPLTAGLILMSAATREMVLTQQVERGLRWYFAGGISIAVLETALMGWMHLSLDAPGTALIPRNIRLLFRVIVAVIFAVLPLAGDMPNLEVLGIHAGILAVLIIAETIGKIGTQSAESTMTPEHIEEAKNNGKGGKWGRYGHEVNLDDLTDEERGEHDVGVEEDLGEIRVRSVAPHQRLAYTS